MGWSVEERRETDNSIATARLVRLMQQTYGFDCWLDVSELVYLLHVLRPKERFVLDRRIGLGEAPILTFKEIAKLRGVGLHEAHRLFRVALRRLRRRLQTYYRPEPGNDVGYVNDGLREHSDRDGLGRGDERNDAEQLGDDLGDQVAAAATRRDLC